MKKNTLADIEARLVRNPETGCEEWPGAKTVDGYGLVAYEGKTRRVHRLRYEKHHEVVLPTTVVVRHQCDNPLCAALSHLVVGSQRDNAQDRDDRLRRAPPRGSRHGRSLITEEIVVEIRSAAGTLKDLSARFGLSIPQISAIRTRRAWKHVA